MLPLIFPRLPKPPAPILDVVMGRNGCGMKFCPARPPPGRGPPPRPAVGVSGEKAFWAMFTPYLRFLGGCTLRPGGCGTTGLGFLPGLSIPGIHGTGFPDASFLAMSFLLSYNCVIPPDGGTGFIAEASICIHLSCVVDDAPSADGGWYD